MHKTLALILSLLFLFEIFLVGIPLAQASATPLPKQGQGVAFYISQYSSVAFVYNVSGIKASISNLTYLAGNFSKYFNVTVQVKFPNGTTYTQSLPITGYADDIYFAINTTSNETEYVIILADVIGNTSVKGQYVPAKYIYYETGIPSSLEIVNATNESQTMLFSIPVIKNITAKYVENDIVNPESTKPSFFYEYVYGVLTKSFTIGKVSLSKTPTNTVLVFAPFQFVSPGFTNPLQQSGLLGKSLQSVSSVMPVIWGRALINLNLFDPYGADNLTFQLNYSVSGELLIKMSQMGWIASINNFPSQFTYLSYNFSNGYESFLGVITDEGQVSVAVNGQSVSIPPSGEVSVAGKNYSILLFTVTKKPIKTEYLSNLTVYYYYLEGFNKTEFSHLNSYQLPVYNLNASAGSKITIQGEFNGTSKTITILVGNQPNMTVYTDYATLSATAYEGIINNASKSFYVTAPILSTPPSTVLIHGITSFIVEGNLTPTSGSAILTLFNNASLPLSSLLPGISFDGVIITPDYPLINGSTAMQYMGTMQYQRIDGEYGMEIIGSQIPMGSIYGDLEAVDILPPFSTTLLAPSLPASLSGNGLLEINFEANTQYSYITLVDMGLWSNETEATVSAYSEDGNQISSNTGYFYGIVIPPAIVNVTKSFNESVVLLYDPDAILDPGNATGSFTVAPSLMMFGNKEVLGSLVFLGSTVYNTQGVFATPSFNITAVGSFGYSKEMLVYNNIPAYQLTLNGQTVIQYANGSYPSLLQYYADNNPTANIFFEQSVGYPSIRPMYYAGLNVSLLNNLLSPQEQPGYEDIVPSGAYYYIYIYPTFKVLPYYAPTISPFNISSFAAIMPNSTFVNSVIWISYRSSDYASYHYFPNLIKINVTVQNVTAKLYFEDNITPLYSPYAKLYYYEPYYGASLPTYLALGTYGTMIWHSPIYYEFGVPASVLYLARMLYVNISLQNGEMFTIELTTKNVTSLFVSGIGQQIKPYNGTYMFEVSIPGLEKILNLSAAELNQSILTVTVYDFVTHETLTASTKLLALPGLNLISSQPGNVFYFMTFRANTAVLTASTPWFVAHSIIQPVYLEFSDQQYAHENLYSVLHLSITNVTVEQGSYKASVVYQDGYTIVTNVYGKVVANYSGDLIPPILETTPGSGIFEGIIPFTILKNNTITPLKFGSTTVYANGTLGFELSNGAKVPLGPAGLFVLPVIAYNGQVIGYQANVYISVSDGITSMLVQTQLQSSNETPIRLSPVPIKPPMMNAPEDVYYYNSPVVITPTAPVINVFATSIIPYPYEFFIVAIVRPGVNASTTAPVVYYSYQAVVAKPALGTPSQPYIEVAIQMNGIESLSKGQHYTVELFAVPFAQGPAISDYPAMLVFTNVSVIS